MGYNLIVFVQLSLRNKPVQFRYFIIYTRNNTMPRTALLEIESTLSLFSIFFNYMPNSLNVCTDKLVNHLHLNTTWCVYFGTLTDGYNLRSSLSEHSFTNASKLIIMPDQQMLLYGNRFYENLHRKVFFCSFSIQI